ncbi:hypothetical protein PoB_001212700 [Plakobranchus ocellatus]|uniref:Uncharacterized protein n=1 Tax=Plakobranchus ocellatus TaxID=259542 RepID=A0AAV3YRQ6_9GAST|nr:hypothetical protein PoB_001212700 [Plakobranchus ocellatus]
MGFPDCVKAQCLTFRRFTPSRELGKKRGDRRAVVVAALKKSPSVASDNNRCKSRNTERQTDRQVSALTSATIILHYKLSSNPVVSVLANSFSPRVQESWSPGTMFYITSLPSGHTPRFACMTKQSYPLASVLKISLNTYRYSNINIRRNDFNMVLLPSPGLALRITDSRLSRSPENQRTGTSMSSLFQFWNTGFTAGIPIPGVSGCGILRYHCLISS